MEVGGKRGGHDQTHFQQTCLRVNQHDGLQMPLQIHVDDKMENLL